MTNSVELSLGATAFSEGIWVAIASSGPMTEGQAAPFFMPRMEMAIAACYKVIIQPDKPYLVKGYSLEKTLREYTIQAGMEARADISFEGRYCA